MAGQSCTEQSGGAAAGGGHPACLRGVVSQPPAGAPPPGLLLRPRDHRPAGRRLCHSDFNIASFRRPEQTHRRFPGLVPAVPLRGSAGLLRSFLGTPVESTQQGVSWVMLLTARAQPPPHRGLAGVPVTAGRWAAGRVQLTAVDELKLRLAFPKHGASPGPDSPCPAHRGSCFPAQAPPFAPHKWPDSGTQSPTVVKR